MVALSDQEKSIQLRLPLPERKVFRYRAADDMLELLSNNPHTEFTTREVRSTTENSPSTVKDSVELLSEMDLIEVRHEGNKKMVRINRSRLSVPDDPFLRIPQEEFRDPVKAITDELVDGLTGVLGVVVFGSVSKGTADRTSDVDVWILVEGERAVNQNEAHEIARDLEDERFDGDRYSYHVLVESVGSAGRFGEDLSEILAEGIVVHGTEEFDEVKQEVLKDG